MAEKGVAVELLGRIPLFAGLAADELAAIAAVAEEVQVPAGRNVVWERTPGRYVFLLVEGAATVERDGRTVGSAGPGDVIGEIAVVTRMSRAATVTTTAPSRLLVIDADAFRSLMETIPALASVTWTTAEARLD